MRIAPRSLPFSRGLIKRPGDNSLKATISSTLSSFPLIFRMRHTLITNQVIVGQETRTLSGA